MSVNALPFPFPGSARNESFMGGVTMPETAVGLGGLAVPTQAEVSVAERVIEAESLIRAATPDDLDALVRVELDAHPDVYGKEPTPAVITDVHGKYEQRIGLLGSYIRVLEHPEQGVYGMIVCCPTNMGREDFMSESRDPTSNDTVRDMFDADGRNAYIVNLAVLPQFQGRGEHYKLFADAIQLGMEHGIENTYFKSRLRGFERWLQEQYLIAERLDVPSPTPAELADVYWRLTEVRDGIEQPKDSLLRMYTNFGCEPLRLIEDAWKPDSSSHGFGVLCEFKNPAMASAETPPSDGGPEEKIGFMRRVFEWAKARKKGLFLGGIALSGMIYNASQGGTAELIKQAKENVDWFLPAYGGSWAVLLAGAGIMMAGAGQKVNPRNLFQHPIQEMRAVAAELHGDNNVVKTGFWMNAVGSVAAAGFAVGACLHLPVAVGLSAVVAPVVDLYSTLALRYWMYGVAKPKSNAISE